MTIIIIVVAILLTFGLVKLVDKPIISKFKPVLTGALWILIAFLGYQTFHSVYGPIQFNKVKEKRYKVIINSLIDIRDAQLAHRQVTGKFASNFDNLVKFIDTAEFTLTQRRDTSILDVEMTKRFGGVETFKEEVLIDTLGFASIKDSLFKGSEHYKTMMNVAVDTKKYDKWLETIDDEKKREEMEAGKIFQLKSGFIKQNNIQIPVFEASVKKDVILFDQDRDLVIQENQVVSVEGVNGNALKVGSMEEVNTNGNWPKVYGSNN